MQQQQLEKEETELRKETYQDQMDKSYGWYMTIAPILFSVGAPFCKFALKPLIRVLASHQIPYTFLGPGPYESGFRYPCGSPCVFLFTIHYERVGGP